MDVIRISEMRGKTEDIRELNSGNIQYHQRPSTGITSKLGFLINKNWKTRINEVTCVSH